jgi:hypothetical protein
MRPSSNTDICQTAAIKFKEDRTRVLRHPVFGSLINDHLYRVHFHCLTCSDHNMLHCFSASHSNCRADSGYVYHHRFVSAFGSIYVDTVVSQESRGRSKLAMASALVNMPWQRPGTRCRHQGYVDLMVSYMCSNQEERMDTRWVFLGCTRIGH